MSEKTLGQIAYDEIKESDWYAWEKRSKIEQARFERAAQAVADRVRAADANEIFRLSNIIKQHAETNAKAWEGVKARTHKYDLGDEVWVWSEDGSVQPIVIRSIYLLDGHVGYSGKGSIVIPESYCMTREQAVEWVLNGGKKDV